jgi:hypothetical protein
MLGITAASVGRYENGDEPSRAVLYTLSRMAKGAEITVLEDFFSVKRRAALLSTIENLPTAGSARRIAITELSNWSEMAAGIHARANLLATRTVDFETHELRRVIDPNSDDALGMLSEILDASARISVEILQYLDSIHKITIPNAVGPISVIGDNQETKQAIQEVQNPVEKSLNGETWQGEECRKGKGPRRPIKSSTTPKKLVPV